MGDYQSDAGDSAYDESICSTESLASSIYNYEKEHGRTYHAFHAGKYIVPNDEREQDRMDVLYHAVRLALDDKLFHAPIAAPTAVLDVGTGTGIWAMDVADEFPGAEVIGIDLSPIQPVYVPPNLEFEICDADEQWGFKSNRFDLVHARIMNDYTLKSWPNFYQQAFSILKPGGWVENQEMDHHRRSDDNSIPLDSKLAQWETEWTRGIKHLGVAGRSDPQVMAGQMHEAGFIKITIREFKLPIGPWPKDPQLKKAGTFALANLSDGLQGLSVKLFTGLLGWSTEELEILLMQCRTEMKRRSVHSYCPLYVVTGQKPTFPSSM